MNYVRFSPNPFPDFISDTVAEVLNAVPDIWHSKNVKDGRDPAAGQDEEKVSDVCGDVGEEEDEASRSFQEPNRQIEAHRHSVSLPTKFDLRHCDSYIIMHKFYLFQMT